MLGHKSSLGALGRPARAAGPLRLPTSGSSTRPYVCKAKRQPRENPEEETGVGLKAVWYLAEAFGKAVGSSKTGQSAQPAPAGKVLTRQQIIDSIREDYSQNYFISGVGDMSAYADDCVFADPFVSFAGTERFKQNVSNFSGVLQDVMLDVYEFNELGEDRVQTKWRFSCILDLPWRPLLAAAGSTTHVLDLQTGKVVKHIENWDVEPSKVVAQLLRPASKIPTNAWETFLFSAGEGDWKGMWLVLSPLFLRASAPVVLASLGCKLITGEGLPGTALGALEGVSWLLLVSAAVTELYKLIKLTGWVERGAR